jgi:hypothetical protein
MTENLKEIRVCNSRPAIVDADDYDRLSALSWHLDNGGYAVSNKSLGGGKWFTFRMHRMAIECQPCDFVDHINGNRLDNRRSNLRTATRRVNAINRMQSKISKTGYKGVFPLRGKFQASIRNNGTSHYLGTFHDPALAALEYNRAAVRLHGDLARLNAVC